MKKFALVVSGSILTLAACAYQEAPDTRGQSFTTADKNQDGRLTYGEYQDYLQLRAVENEKDASHVLYSPDPKREKTILLKFQGYDDNRDTFIDRSELGIVN